MHHFSVGWGEAVMSLALPPHRVQEGGVDGTPMLGFRYVTIFRKYFTVSRKPVMCSTR